MTPLALGAVVGLVLGLTGAGGSIFAVPLLMWGLGWTLPEAAPVALLAVAGAAAFGTIAAWDVRFVRYRAALLLAVVAWCTAPLGLRAARVLPVHVLTLGFAAVLAVVALRMMLQALRSPEDASVVRAGRESPVCHVDPLTGRFDWTPASVTVMGGIGALTGFLAGLLGVGGGFVIVPALRTFSDLSMHAAVATSLMAIALISAGTVIAATAQGHALPWNVALPFMAGALAGMLAGRMLAPRVAGPALQTAFALCMMVVAAGMALHAPGHG